MRPRPPAFGLALALILVACSAEPAATPRPECPTGPPVATAGAVLEGADLATVTVTGAVKGEFSFELYGDQAPVATANFVALARCGFYDGIWFHRVIAGFVIQAGDPQTKTQRGDFDGLGQGGPGYAFQVEPPADDLNYVQYSVAMANDTQANGSQFFISLVDLAGRLDRLYTIFGQVTSGTDVVDAIGQVPVNDPRLGLPLEQVTIESIVISSASEPAPSGD